MLAARGRSCGPRLGNSFPPGIGEGRAVRSLLPKTGERGLKKREVDPVLRRPRLRDEEGLAGSVLVLGPVERVQVVIEPAEDGIGVRTDVLRDGRNVDRHGNFRVAAFLDRGQVVAPMPFVDRAQELEVCRWRFDVRSVQAGGLLMPRRFSLSRTASSIRSTRARLAPRRDGGRARASSRRR